ncbi:MAG: SEC-C metal-binding domain-containing protein, partial [Pseudomonadota bacterium]
LHLDHLRQGINLRAFAQRDPLNEYKAEAFNMFSAMMDLLRDSIVKNLSMIEINIDEQAFSEIEQQQRAAEEEKAQLTRSDPAAEQKSVRNAAENPPIPFRPRFDQSNPATWEGNVPRNMPCPCGSDKKFKYCHGKID